MAALGWDEIDTCERRGMAQVGSASALGAEGRRFKSGYPDTATELATLCGGEAGCREPERARRGTRRDRDGGSGYPDGSPATRAHSGPPSRDGSAPVEGQVAGSAGGAWRGKQFRRGRRGAR